MGCDFAAVIVEEFAILARLVEHCHSAKAAGRQIPPEELDRLSNPLMANLPEEFFDPSDLDVLREVEAACPFEGVWHEISKAMHQLTDTLKNPNCTESDFDAQIAFASQTICAQLGRVRVASAGRLTHPLLHKLWLTFRCDS